MTVTCYVCSCLAGDDTENTLMIYATEVVIEASRASASMQPLHYSRQVSAWLFACNISVMFTGFIWLCLMLN